MGKEKNPRSGFTRADLLVVVGCICILGVVWIRPSLASTSARNDEVVCANNLRTIGQAFSQWWQDHDERSPWYTPVDPSQPLPPLRGNVWFQFSWVSNELSSPRYLADPADDWSNLRVATSWGNEPGGLMALGNNAVSYFFGLHATPLAPQAVLAGDGNIRGGGMVGCSSTVRSVTDTSQYYALWPNSWHENRGNLLFCDGRVEITDTPRLKEVTGYATWNIHVLKPRNF